LGSVDTGGSVGGSVAGSVAGCVGSGSSSVAGPEVAGACGAHAEISSTKTVIRLKTKYFLDTAFLSSGKIGFTGSGKWKKGFLYGYVLGAPGLSFIL
jgi:hypothetical protein